MTDPLEARVDAAVTAVLERRRAEVERLVADRVDRELSALVDQAVDRQLGRVSANGDAAPAAPLLCVDCGKKPRAKWRTRCASCQLKRQREQRHANKAAAAATGEEPHPPLAAA
jgi:hypothetical protein